MLITSSIFIGLGTLLELLLPIDIMTGKIYNEELPEAEQAKLQLEKVSLETGFNREQAG